MPNTSELLKKSLVSFLVLAFLLVCSNRAEARAESASSVPGEVSICLGGAPGIPPLVAQEKGLFAAAGVTVQRKQYRTAAEGFEGFLRGECDLSAVSETSVVMKSFEHQDFSILATIATSDNSPRLLASRKSGIATPQDLKGKRIFVLQWSSNHFFLEMFLAKNALTEKDVTMVFTGVPDIPAAMMDGSIDAFCATEVLIDKPLRALGKDAVIFDSPGLCLVSFHLVAKNTLITARPEVIKKILSAMLENEAFIHENRSVAVKTAAAAMGMEERVMDSLWGNYNWQVGLSQATLLSMEQEAQWAINAGFTSKTRVPNYLKYVHQETLRALRPEAVTILK